MGFQMLKLGPVSLSFLLSVGLDLVAPSAPCLHLTDNGLNL